MTLIDPRDERPDIWSEETPRLLLTCGSPFSHSTAMTARQSTHEQVMAFIC